jgi:FtsP/CotA-like multicopper oxidase with cupredoxin domain
MMIDRRDFLKLGSFSLLTAAAPRLRTVYAQESAKADYTIEVANGLAELGPDQITSTTLYNGQFPGPLLRFKEGRPVTVDIVNKTDHPELLHWHGQKIPSDVDGAEEEGSRVVAPSTTLRETFTSSPWFSLLPYACACRRRSEPRPIFRPGWPGLYRAEGQFWSI